MAHIQHFSHPHPLYEERRYYSIWNCGLCNQLINETEQLYCCYGCRYQIHIRCAEFPEHINNSLHSTHSLTLLEKSSSETSIRCFYCEKPIEDLCFAYSCKECAFYMHVECGVIPQPTLLTTNHGAQDDDDLGVVQFSCHQHPMELAVEHGDGEDNNLGKKCIACQLPCSYPAYSCSTLSCPNCFHKSCVDKLPHQIQHPFHSHKPLTLQISKLQSCDLCFKKDCRLVFSCHETGCTFKVGTECAFLDTIVRCRSHDHLLFLVEGSYFDNIKCDACQKSYKELNNHVAFEIHLTRQLLFRCMECDFNLHFICGPLPCTIKCNYHIHRLTLLDSVVEDNCHEYYCDMCEEERNSDFRLYNCSDCKYEAHIHCFIDQVLKLMKRSNDMELWALGENQWNWNIAIGEKDGNNTSKETLEDIMSCLTQQEKYMLLHPWTARGYSFSSARSSYEHYKNATCRFHQLGESIEDFGAITDFFQNFDSFKQDFGEEFVWYVCEKGLEVEGKYLRQEVMEVDGKYKVPNTLAPILKTLLGNYCPRGDLGGDPSLSSAMKSVLTTLLLALIDKMCRTKIEDVTWDDLKQWFFYLYYIYWLGWFKVCRDTFNLIKKFVQGYWSSKVIRCKQVSESQINAKIEYLKGELKRWEENLYKLKQIDMNDFLRTEGLSLKKKSGDDDMDYSESLAWQLKHTTVGDLYFEILDEKLG